MSDATIEQTDATPDGARRRTILIVEDTPDQAELLRYKLEEAGYNVIEAHDGAEGLAAASMNHPDAIVSDVMMPVMDGYGLCRAIRRDKTLKLTPIILLTVLSDPLDVIRGLDAGADAYVGKPYDILTLVSRIESLLAFPTAAPPPVERRKIAVRLGGETHMVDAHGPRMLNLLVSAYENSVVQNRELLATQQALKDLNQHLEQLVSLRTAALRESEEKLRDIVEHSTNLFYSHTPDHVLTYMSAQTLRFLDCTPEEALVRWTTFLTDNPVNQLGVESTRRAIDTGEPQPAYELELVGRKGRRIWVQVNEAPIVRDGKTVAVVGSLTDITGRKLAEDALRARETQLNTALKIGRMAHWEYDVTGDRFTFNDNFYAIFRTTADQEGGYTMSSAEYARRFVHPDDMAVVGTEIQAAIECADPDFSSEIEHRIVYADGEIGHIAVRFFVVKNAQGRTVKTFGVNQDITKRKIEEREAEFKSTVIATQQETSPDAILLVDENARILSYNKRFTDLWNIPEALVRAGDDAPVLQWVVRQTREPEIFAAEVRRLYEDRAAKSHDEVETSDGRVVDRYSAPVVGPNGVYYGRVWYFRDITGRKRAEEQLRRLNWALLALSKSNSALVHAGDEPELFRMCCEAVASSEAYPLAWIGLAREDAEHSVEIVGAAGEAIDYLEGFEVSWGETPLGKGPTGTAIRIGATQVLNDFTASTTFRPWLERARAKGLASSIAVPIRVNGKVFGALTVYSREPAAFGPILAAGWVV